MKETHSAKKIIDWKVIKRISVFTNPYRGLFLVSIVVTILLGILAPVRPYLIGEGINTYIANKDEQGFIEMIILLVVLAVLQALIQFFHTYLSGWLGQQIIKDIRIALYRHILRFRLSFFDKTPVGKLVTRCTSDIETLAQVFTDGLASIVGDILQLIFIVGMMLYVDWKLTLIVLSTMPFLLIATYIFKEKMKVAFSQVRTAVSNLNTFVQEHITGMNIVQIFNSEERELQKFTKLNQAHRKANIKTVNYYSLYYPVAELLGAVSVGLLMSLGAKFIMDETTEVGTLIAFIMLLHIFFRPIRMIADRFNIIQLGIVSSQRILNLLDEKVAIEEQGEGKFDIQGMISFRNVWFGYKPDEYVLKDISFEVQQNQSVAFVGATGAGKSSIIKLINKYYNIQKGQILIDGKDLSQINNGYLRRKVSTVLQDIFLFSGSIRDNITLGRSDISDAFIYKICDMLGARSLIESRPQKLDYQVMERGGTLSMGQKQLICFVRAMVNEPRLLILDEATASIDSESERLIQNAIAKMMKGRTSIIIAHRLSTIREADKIIVMHKGKIVETGTHDTLLEKRSYYYQLHKIQYEDALEKMTG